MKSDPYANHPGHEATCPLKTVVTQRSPYGVPTSCGYGCAVTGGHCVPDSHCDERRKREADREEHLAQVERFNKIYPFQKEMS